ncbi:MAG: cytochrome c [Solirubrobacterales bacterium]
MSGGRSNEGRRTVQAWIYGILAGIVVLALMGIAYTIGSNSGGDETTTTEAAKPTTTEKTTTEKTGGSDPGQELFVANCGSCHTLSAAGTTGTTGPDLDSLAPDEALVKTAIENGGAGSGVMPPNLVTGKEEQEVSAYVASSAGG